MPAQRFGPARLAAAALIGAAALLQAAHAQVADRTIEEIKVEAQARAERGAYPLIGLDPADVREALGAIATRDPDDWARGWAMVADRYVAKARAAATPAEADASYLKAWRLYYFGQWPAPTSPGKQENYRKALDAYRMHAEKLDPPLEVVRIPFDGAEIVGYLRLPKAGHPVPVVMVIAGLDSRKETAAVSHAALLAHGIGFFAVDGPGTGEAPVKASDTADRMFSRVLDHLAARPDIDRTRILVHGMSFGGYWAAKLAFTERDRLRGAVAQSPPVHEAFQEAFFRATLHTREYLFDHLPATLKVLGAASLDEAVALRTRLSLKTQGLVGRPAAPLLVVGGVKDTQVPIADLDLLIHSGTEPREAWINPAGGHMGREAKGWTDPVILRKVILPWLVRTANGE